VQNSRSFVQWNYVLGVTMVLGVTITSSLNWSKHIDTLKAKASRKMVTLRRGQQFLPKSALTTL
jgi:hypothetical protein